MRYSMSSIGCSSLNSLECDPVCCGVTEGAIYLTAIEAEQRYLLACDTGHAQNFTPKSPSTQP